MRSIVNVVGRGARLLPALLLLACVPPAAVAQAQTPTADGATVALTVTVTNARGEFVMGLGANDFAVTAGGRAREVAYARVVDAPASVGVLIDTSGSMGYISSQRIANDKTVRESVGRFVRLGHDANDYFVARVGTRPELLSDWSRAERVNVAGVNSEEMARATALYDSVFAAVEKLRGALNSKRVVVLVSDGLDTVSEHKLEEVARLLAGGDVILYAVGVFGGNDPRNFSGDPNLNWQFDKDGRDVLEELAAATGGKVFYPADAKEFAAAFDAIAVELRHQYELGVRLGADTAAAKKPLALKVKVNPPSDRPDFKRLSARTRKAYVPKS
ncbi:MAG TPA: VWA domain-containing protein [Pyrinomonadaceae bacterium]|jgi:VWFA-related protein